MRPAWPTTIWRSSRAGRSTGTSTRPSGPSVARGDPSSTCSTCSRTRRASGLHVGHPEGYTATDIVARYKRMRGFDVLHPMGWDAFGLPAEQHAINTGTHPSATTQENIEIFRRQLKSSGFSYDWSREVNTTDPATCAGPSGSSSSCSSAVWHSRPRSPSTGARRSAPCWPTKRSSTGKSERGGFPVVRQPLRQWQLRITAYADRLAEDLEPLDWPETKQKQREWIGRSEGRGGGLPAGRAGARLTRLHDAPGHAVRRDVHGDRARPPRSRCEITLPERRAEVDGVRRGCGAQERPRAHRAEQGEDRRVHRRLRR